MTLARRLAEIEPFLAVEVAERAQAMEREGIDVVHLEYGEPDFAPPAVAEGVARAAWDTGAARRRRRFDVSVIQ